MDRCFERMRLSEQNRLRSEHIQNLLSNSLRRPVELETSKAIDNASLRTAKMDDQLTESTTKISDLNDDCLREVFAVLELRDLTAVADVCIRFRQNAVQCARMKSVHLKLAEDSSVYDYSMLRNFGAFVKSLVVSIWDGTRSRVKYQNRFIELSNRYCTGGSIELEFSHFYNPNETEHLKQLLARVRKLIFFRCNLTNSFLKNLALWSPELCELKFSGNWSKQYYEDMGVNFVHLHRKFPKLESISFCGVRDVNNTDINEFLKQNPQLKQIGISSCAALDDRVFQSIDKYLPGIEALFYGTSYKQTYRYIIRHFGQFRKLKSLTMRVSNGEHHILSVLRKISSANIFLEVLDLAFLNVRDITQQFIEGISGLQKLKTLRLSNVDNLAASDVIEMCKHLEELLEIRLERIDLKMTGDDLLALIRNAEKLEKFEYQVSTRIKIIIDGDTFKKLMQIVDERREKIMLSLHLSRWATVLHIPPELARSAKNSVKVNIC